MATDPILMPAGTGKSMILALPTATGKSVPPAFEKALALLTQRQVGLPSAEELATMPPAAREYRRRVLGQIVDGVLEILRTSEQWTQQAAARDATGRRVDPRGPEAERWCVTGAIHRVTGLLRLQPFSTYSLSVDEELRRLFEGGGGLPATASATATATAASPASYEDHGIDVPVGPAERLVDVSAYDADRGVAAVADGDPSTPSSTPGSPTAYPTTTPSPRRPSNASTARRWSTPSTTRR